MLTPHWKVFAALSLVSVPLLALTSVWAQAPTTAPSGAKYTRDPAISVGELHVDGNTTLAPGDSVTLWIDPPSDYDSWTTTDGQSGQEADDLSGVWSQGGMHYSTTSGYSTVWTAPDRVGTYVPMLTVNDSLAYGSTNGRNDVAVTRKVTLTVSRDAVSTPTPTVTATVTPTPTATVTPTPTLTPTPPYKIWSAGTPIEAGTLRASVGEGAATDAAPAPQVLWVAPGATVNLSVTGASDSDHWVRSSSSESGDEADTLVYSWSGADSDSSSATVTAPDQGSVFVSCTVADQPTAVVSPDTGSRHDADETHTVEIRVSQKTWDAGTAIQGGQQITSSLGSAPVVYADQGQAVTLTVDAASDSDHWTYMGQEGSEADTVSYHWTVNGATVAGGEGQSLSWTAPTLPAGVSSEEFHFQCQADDQSPVIPAGEVGTRDDAPQSASFSIAVMRKQWTPGAPLSGGEITMVAPGADGTAQVAPGGTVQLQAGNVTDQDHWSKDDGTEGDEADNSPLSYTWTASLGHFQVSENGQTTSSEQAHTSTVTWVAPADSQSATAVLTCSIDDGTGAPVNSPTEGGSRDDAAVDRTFSVSVVAPTWSATPAIGQRPVRNAQGEITGGGLPVAKSAGHPSHCTANKSPSA